jgi:solute carrier family 13 (sodium-dependent dicarboxylate transporter), member 2/3/5
MTATNSKGNPKSRHQKDTGKTADMSAVYKRIIGMGGGLLLFIIMILSSPPEGLSKEGWYTAAIAILMAVWWATEVIPIPVTALLPWCCSRFSIFPV